MKLLTVTIATPVTFDSGSGGDCRINSPMTVAAVPGSGGNLLVEYQVVEDGSWTEWPHGTVTAKTINVLSAPVYALRFTAGVADGVIELGF